MNEKIKTIENIEYRKDGAFCIIIHNGEIFFQKRKDNQKFELPGGGIDDGEDPIDSINREVFEEAGIVLDKQTYQVGKFEQKLSKKAADHLKVETGTVYLFLNKIKKIPKIQLSYESSEFAWFSIQKLKSNPELFSPACLGMLQIFLDNDFDKINPIGKLGEHYNCFKSQYES